MTKSFKQILLSVILLICALAFMNSCKKDPVHFLCHVTLGQYCLPDTNGSYSTFGYPSFLSMHSADIKNSFANGGFTYDPTKIKSAHFSNFKIAVATDSLLMNELTYIDVRVRKDTDTQLGNQIGYKWMDNDSVASVNLDLTGSDINGIFKEENFTVLIRTFNYWMGNRYICLQPTDLVIDFELDASAKK